MLQFPMQQNDKVHTVCQPVFSAECCHHQLIQYSTAIGIDHKKLHDIISFFLKFQIHIVKLYNIYKQTTDGIHYPMIYVVV